MREIGTSSLWEKKYEPKFLEDYICSDTLRAFVQDMINTKEVPSLMLCGIQGTGKTSLARVIANELEMDYLYINGSLENSIDDVRYKVKQFASTSSMMGGKKLVIIDEADRLSGGSKVGAVSNPAQDALKVLIEQTEANARFVFCTNNPKSIIPALHSRCRVINFGDSIPKELQVQYFKRLRFILDSENIKYDKKSLVDLTQKFFPDFRKLINEVQMSAQTYGVIDERVLACTDSTKTLDLITEMKAKKFSNIRKLCEEIDTNTFFREFYDIMDEYLVDTCRPNVILTLNKGQVQDTQVNDKSINLAACIIELMSDVKWK